MFGAAAAAVMAVAAIATSAAIAKGKGGTVSGAVSITAGGKAKRARGGIVVAIEGVGKAPKPMRAVMKQKDKQFAPQLLVVTKGSEISFPNEDKIFHNVFSISKAARFDLGLYKSGEEKSVKLRRAGVVDVYCNIHPEMVAKIKVLETSYYAVTAPDGSFSIGNVPAGTYPITAWQPNGEEYRGEVTVEAGGAATIDIPLVEGEGEARHTRKDGTPYGRYK
jgi:plastocyanin